MVPSSPHSHLLVCLGNSVTTDKANTYAQQCQRVCEVMNQFCSVSLDATILELRRTYEWQEEQTEVAEVMELDTEGKMVPPTPLNS
jgi:hypothetical protein